MLSPKKEKYRRRFRPKTRRVAIKGDRLTFGKYGIKAMSACWITDRQIESCRIVLARATRKQGKFWLRIFPDTPYTKKPPEVGMGAGKGDVSHYVVPVSPGRVLFELDGLDEKTARNVLQVVGTKLPVPVKFIERKE